MTGPITFANETAREQLLSEGTVVTFRPSERTTGETWARWSRLGPAEADVVVEEEAHVNTGGLMIHMFADESGFDSSAKWLSAISELHGGTLPKSGYLYRVDLLSLRGDVEEGSA